MSPLRRLLVAGWLAGCSVIALAQAPGLTDGEVRKIDAANARVTIKHGEIKNLNMPGMTMVFVAKDARLLDGLAVGDKIQFAAEQGSGGQLLVTQIRKAK
ncbi:MAG TPA: copper-binding protein [Burkholderiaceae bacterium]|nr:copper-binding protein [Burkholderiaceae bacterium]